MILVQLSWIFDFAPGWLGPLCMFVGSFLLLTPSTVQTVSKLYDEAAYASTSDARQQVVAMLGLIGFGLITLPAFFDNLSVFGIGFFLIGRWIEGLGASKIVWRIGLWLFSDGSFQKPHGGSSVIYYLLLVFVVLAGIGVVVLILALLTAGEISGSAAQTRILVVWTLTTFVTSVLGCSYKLWGGSLGNDSPYPETYVPVMLIGAILAISGAEIYNLQLFAVPGDGLLSDVLAAAVGLVVYAIGYWLGVGNLLSGRSST